MDVKNMAGARGGEQVAEGILDHRIGTKLGDLAEVLHLAAFQIEPIKMPSQKSGEPKRMIFRIVGRAVDAVAGDRNTKIDAGARCRIPH